MSLSLPKILIGFSLLISTFLLLILTLPNAYAANATHVVISEVQTSGATSTDEFVELYNPTDQDILLTDWKLTRKTEGGTESDLIGTVSGTIKSRGYFLFAHTNFTGSTSADQTYSENAVSANNTILLYDSNSSVVDKVGFGSATDREGTSETDPGANSSRERKATTTSTPESMGTGGDDEFIGNGEDTDNNADDFVLRTVPQPQNSVSPTEPVTTSPTEGPTVTETPTPTEEPTPTPTNEPTSTPTPTEEPTPTSTPTPTPIVIANYQIQCTAKIKTISILTFEFTISIPSCKLVKI